VHKLPLNIEWSLDPDNRARVEPHLERALILAPSWVDTLFIELDTENSGTVSIAFSHQYRCGRIIFSPEWFACSEKDQGTTLIHEMIHIHLSVMSQVYRDLIEATLDEGPMQKWCKSVWENAEEQAVSDLSFIFNYLLEENGKCLPTSGT
jgi:hypothetical protein